MVDKVLDTIRRYNLIENGDNVIVGFSGGPDSACLLHILYTLSRKLSISLYAVHINHMLRGRESDEDEDFARSFCSSIGIPIHVKSYDIGKMAREHGISGEEAGREARYNEFAHYADSLGGAKIAVAHNKNDQAETLLMRIIRGTGIDGLKGMSHKRDNIIRPLLDIDRKEIENYCLLNKLNPITDSTNLKSIYTRNKVRLKLIPYINENFEVDIVESLYRMSRVMDDDLSIIENAVKRSYDEALVLITEDRLELDINKLCSLDKGLAGRVLRNGLKNIKGNLNGIESIHIENIVKLIDDGRTGAIIQLPHGLRAQRTYKAIRLYKEAGLDKVIQYNTAIRIPGTTRIAETGAAIEAAVININEDYKKYIYNSDKSLEQFFDYKKLIKGINIRNRVEGDIFKPLKSNGTKKLKKYFIDEKVLREIRDKIPLIAVDNEIIWAVGYKTSDNFRVTENTKTALWLKYIPEAEEGRNFK